MVKKCSVLLLFLLVSVLSWQRMIYQVKNLSEFGDEWVSVQSAVSFFKNGRYESEVEGLIFSSGIVVTWPGAVGWTISHNITGSRLWCALVPWVLAHVLGFLFFTREGYAKEDALLISSFIWALTITPPFSIPYWHGFIYNLGELSSVIIIGFGLLLISKHPLASAFLFGTAVWQGKLLYGPFVTTVLLANLCIQKFTVKKFLAEAGKYAAVFLLPVVLWIAWICIRVNVETLYEWFDQQMKWVVFMNDMHGAGLVESKNISLAGLLERLGSPQLEWIRYSFGTKAKVMFYTLGMVCVMLAGIVAPKFSKLNVSSREKWFSLMGIFTILIFSFWWFFIHDFMWLRHIQPTIYVSFGFLIYWANKWGTAYPKQARPVFYSGAALLLMAQIYQALQPLIR